MTDHDAVRDAVIAAAGRRQTELTKAKPLTIDDIGPRDPLMRWAWQDFVAFACEDADMIEQYKAETGIVIPSRPRNGLEAMIDKATGFDQQTDQIALAYIKWTTTNYWGDEEITV